MELKKRVDFRKLVVFGYFALLAVYLVIGLTPAEAADYNIRGNLEIPSIGLRSDVTESELKDYRLSVPATIVGSFSQHTSKTLLVGHSSTVFERLGDVQVGDPIVFNADKYVVEKMVVLEKSQISMNMLLSDTDTKTVVLMTCAGEDLGGGDATHRLIIYAKIVASENE